MTGEEKTFNAEETLQFAQYGFGQALEKENEQGKKPTETTEELEPEERITKLEKKIEDMQTRTKQDKQIRDIHSRVDVSLKKYDLTKDGSKWAKHVKILTLAHLNFNGRANPEELVAQYTKEIMDELEVRDNKTKENARLTGKVNDKLNLGGTRGGGMPSIDTSKEFKAEDLMRSNVSQEAFKEFLDRIQAD